MVRGVHPGAVQIMCQGALFTRGLYFKAISLHFFPIYFQNTHNPLFGGFRNIMSFGFGAAASSGGGFGGFGASTAASSGGGFGGFGASTGGGFGAAAPASSGGGFGGLGAASSGGGFGGFGGGAAAAPASGGGFGAAPATGGFGAAPAAGGFGAAPAAAAGGWGAAPAAGMQHNCFFSLSFNLPRHSVFFVTKRQPIHPTQRCSSTTNENDTKRCREAHSSEFSLLCFI